MTETPKVPEGTEISPETIIEIVSEIDWRIVALAAVAAGVTVFVVLALIEHVDDESQIDVTPLRFVDPETGE